MAGELKICHRGVRAGCVIAAWWWDGRRGWDGWRSTKRLNRHMHNPIILSHIPFQPVSPFPTPFSSPTHHFQCTRRRSQLVGHDAHPRQRHVRVVGHDAHLPLQWRSAPTSDPRQRKHGRLISGAACLTQAPEQRSLCRTWARPRTHCALGAFSHGRSWTWACRAEVVDAFDPLDESPGYAPRQRGREWSTRARSWPDHGGS